MKICVWLLLLKTRFHNLIETTQGMGPTNFRFIYKIVTEFSSHFFRKHRMLVSCFPFFKLKNWIQLFENRKSRTLFKQLSHW